MNSRARSFWLIVIAAGILPATNHTGAPAALAAHPHTNRMAEPAKDTAAQPPPKGESLSETAARSAPSSKKITEPKQLSEYGEYAGGSHSKLSLSGSRSDELRSALGGSNNARSTLELAIDDPNSFTTLRTVTEGVTRTAQNHPECGPDAGDCCAIGGNGTPGCDDEDCCHCICNCDPFCCDTSWDTSCAGDGFEPGCGASLPDGLCAAECNECWHIDCFDGICDPGENSCNCPQDCPGGCGACTVFNNQAEFEAFNQEEGKFLKGIEDFEETPPGAGIVGFDDPLCGGIPNGPFPDGIDQLNLCVQSNLLGEGADVPLPRVDNGLVFVELGSDFGESSDLVLANYFVDSTDLMFGDPVPPEQQDNHTGVGFDTVSIFGGGTVAIRVYDKNNVEMMVTASLADPAGTNFWGVWCEDPIGRINIFDTGGGAQGGDNIQMWVDSLCGNGVIDPGEECDPPGSVCPNGQDCLPDCTCPGPVNDHCADSIPIFDGATAYDTTGASTDGLPHEACQFDGQTYHDIWYRYLATCTGGLIVSTCDQADYDTDLVVYDGCFDLIPCPPGDAFLLGCNDDTEGCAGFSSRVTVLVSEGNCYTIRIGGFDEGDQGTGIVTLICVGFPECGNEICEDGENACSCPQDCEGACDCTVFTDQADFEAFNEEEGKLLKGIEDFEETAPGAGIVGFTDPLCGGIPNPPFDTGLDELNLCVQANTLGGAADVPAPHTGPGFGLVFVEFGSGFGESSDIVLANYFAESFDLMFGDPVPPDQQDNHTGVGFDVVSIFGGGTADIRVFDKNNVELLSASSPADAGGSNFWGVWCSSTIGRINIFDTGGGAEGGDNIQMWLEQTGCQSDDDCDDGEACTDDTCNDGVCFHLPVDCSGAGDQCNAASCDPNGADGNCDTLMPLPDGTECDDGAACTEDDQCNAGSCGGTDVDCSGAGDQCNTASCDPNGADGNCDTLTPLPDGTECDDGAPCTEDDQCTAGSCGGTDVDCSGAGEPCEVASCDPGGPSGNCNILMPAKNGTPCDDGSACTAEGVCSDGQCQTEAADCNDNGVPDCQDIDEMTSGDCDGDGVPDECELPKRSGGLCTEGCDPDCDGNGVIDSCDIANCTPNSEDYPACDDCNLNGVPDGCDVDPSDPDGNGQVSDDEDEDGVPDECVEATGSGDWSGDIWDLSDQNPEFPYPDDGAGVPDLSVTLDGEDVVVFLDVDALIHALRLISGASLDVTQTGAPGDLTIVASGLLEGNLLIEGTLTVDGNRTIEAAGRITIGVGGIYKSAVGLEGDVSASLKGDEITIDCGTVELQGTMNMESEGDVILQSSEDDKGDCTPPDFEAGDSSTATAGGDFVIADDATINYDSTEPLNVGGDFDNQSTDAENFNWDDGGVRLNGVLHRFEAAGEDRGPWPAGLEMNFAIGTLTLAADSTARIVDTFDNQQDGKADCDEALYVDLLVVGPGSVLLTEGCRLYYNELLNEGSIPDLGKDVLQILEPCPADFNGDGFVGAADLALLLGSWGPCPGCPADLDGDNIVNAFDLALLLGTWGPCK